MIVPTHNRARRLRRTLEVLTRWITSAEYWSFRGVADMLGNGASVAKYLVDLKRAAAEDLHPVSP